MAKRKRRTAILHQLKAISQKIVGVNQLVKHITKDLDALWALVKEEDDGK